MEERQKSGATVPANAPVLEESSEGHRPVFQPKVAETQIGDEKSIRDLVSIFLEESTELIGTIAAAIDSGEAKELRRAAHTLKSGCDMFGAKRARDPAYQLEQMGKEGRVKDAPETFTVLKEEIEKLRAALKHHWGNP